MVIGKVQAIFGSAFGKVVQCQAIFSAIFGLTRFTLGDSCAGDGWVVRKAAETEDNFFSTVSSQVRAAEISADRIDNGFLPVGLVEGFQR